MPFQDRIKCSSDVYRILLQRRTNYAFDHPISCRELTYEYGLICVKIGDISVEIQVTESRTFASENKRKRTFWQYVRDVLIVALSIAFSWVYWPTKTVHQSMQIDPTIRPLDEQRPCPSRIQIHSRQHQTILGPILPLRTSRSVRQKREPRQVL